MVNVTNVVKEIKRILRDKDIFFRYVNSVNDNSYEIILERGQNEHFLIYKTEDDGKIDVRCVYYRMVLNSAGKLEIRYDRFLSDVELCWNYIELWVSSLLENNLNASKKLELDFKPY